MKPWERIGAVIGFEVDQRRQEGCILGDSLAQEIESAREANDEEKLHRLLDELTELQPASSFSYSEPTALDAIRAERPDGPRQAELEASTDILDHIYGAWLGRAAGCCLGKPVEKWPKQRIADYLEFYGALPLDDYIPMGKGFPEGHPREYYISGEDCTRGNIDYMTRDDDMDYPVLGLHTLEREGSNFTSMDVGYTLLDRMPYNLVATAERIAYRNLVNDLGPPESATYRNPFREWIGAQIRADIWGYVTPGWPEMAAEFAFRDATVSHVKNGVYGEMFVAAMLAGTYIASDIEEAVTIGLSEIPNNCRLAEAVRDTVRWSKQDNDWEQTFSKISERYGHYSDVHAINNAALIVMGLIHGDGDFEKTIVTTVLGGWDADCTGATAGSIAGMILGAKSLPGKWVGVFNDRLKSAVRESEVNKISDLAERSHAVAIAIMKEPGPS